MLRFALLFACAFFTGVALLAQDAAPKGPEAVLQDGLAEKFGSGSVGGVAKERGQVRIRTNLPVVNDAVYMKVILESCRLMVDHAALFQDAKEIAILNRLEKQGYIFKTAARCQSLLEAAEPDAKTLVFAETKFCNRDCQ